MSTRRHNIDRVRVIGIASAIRIVDAVRRILVAIASIRVRDRVWVIRVGTQPSPVLPLTVV